MTVNRRFVSILGCYSVYRATAVTNDKPVGLLAVPNVRLILLRLETDLCNARAGALLMIRPTCSKDVSARAAYWLVSSTVEARNFFRNSESITIPILRQLPV